MGVTARAAARSEDDPRDALVRLAAQAGVAPDEIVALAPVVLYVYDPVDGRSLYQNRPLGGLLGYPPAEADAFGADEWRCLTHPDDQARFPEHRRRLRELAAGEEASFEYRVRHADGGWRWLVSRDVVLASDRAPGGRVVIGSASDVTDARRAEARLRASDARYRSLLENIDQGFCVLEVLLDDAGRPEDYRFLEVNRTFEYHTGLRDPVGRRARELVPGLEQHWVDTYGEVALTGVGRRFDQGSIAMGRLFEVEAVRVGAPEDLRVALLFRDVTERRQADIELKAAEASLREREARLEAALRVKDEFLGLVSHELRTPMTVILGMSRILAGTLHDPERAAAVASDIAQSAEVLNDLVEAMLLLARLDEHEVVRLREPVLLHRSIAGVLDRLRVRLPGRSVELEVAEPGLIVDVQPTWLERVTENLVGNALKYGAGTVVVRVERSGALARIRVLDDGPGLGPDPERLFEPFYRAPGAAERAPGAGLGLAVARRIVDLLGGRIWAEARPEGGSEFTFELPLAALD